MAHMEKLSTHLYGIEKPSQKHDCIFFFCFTAFYNLRSVSEQCVELILVQRLSPIGGFIAMQNMYS